MPQMVRLGDALLVVWRGPSKLTAARVPLSLLSRGQPTYPVGWPTSSLAENWNASTEPER
jgi:hypothetical protein